MHWNANETKSKCNGMQMETQQNGNATERKTNATQTFLQHKHNGTQTAFNANGTGIFYDHYCSCLMFLYMGFEGSLGFLCVLLPAPARDPVHHHSFAWNRMNILTLMSCLWFAEIVVNLLLMSNLLHTFLRSSLYPDIYGRQTVYLTASFDFILTYTVGRSCT